MIYITGFLNFAFVGGSFEDNFFLGTTSKMVPEVFWILQLVPDLKEPLILVQVYEIRSNLILSLILTVKLNI